MRYEGGIDVPDGVPVDTVKEGVSLDLVNVQTSVRVAQKSVRRRYQHEFLSIDAPGHDLPPNHTLCLTAEVNVIRDLQVIFPLNDLLVGLMRTLRAERRVACKTISGSAGLTLITVSLSHPPLTDETLVHDRSQGPPITLLSVTFLQKDLGGDLKTSGANAVSD